MVYTRFYGLLYNVRNTVSFDVEFLKYHFSHSRNIHIRVFGNIIENIIIIEFYKIFRIIIYVMKRQKLA